MKKSILTITLLSSMFLNAQNGADKTDEIIDEMCVSFKNNENISDSERIENLNENFIFPYINQFSEEEREDKINNLFFRFQKRCEIFRSYLQKTNPPKNDNWVRLTSKPKITLSDTEIKNFKKNTNFYYFEYEGEKTKVKTDNNYWIDQFLDGTYSKLYYKWQDKNKFELEFIESNNIGRKNFSKKGDKYSYEIINKENDFYWVLAQTPDQKEMMKFKLFIGK